MDNTVRKNAFPKLSQPRYLVISLNKITKYTKSSWCSNTLKHNSNQYQTINLQRQDRAAWWRYSHVAQLKIWHFFSSHLSLTRQNMIVKCIFFFTILSISKLFIFRLIISFKKKKSGMYILSKIYNCITVSLVYKNKQSKIQGSYSLHENER